MKFFRCVVFIGVIVCIAATTPAVGHADESALVSFMVLHSFAGGATDGDSPGSALIQATDGNFYGTTISGGAANLGAVYRMTPTGAVTVLHSFEGGADGAYPYGRLMQATDGNFYGTTSSGGGAFFCNCGTIFRMTPSGLVSVMHAFTGATDGGSPYAGLIQASDGNLYGTAVQGPARAGGEIFTMTPDGVFTTLYVLQPADGAYPFADLIQAADGNLYGTTVYGGTGNLGTVFRVTPAGAFTVLHAFSGGTDGGAPFTSLLQAADGKLYGTTPSSKSALGVTTAGTVFRLTLAGVLSVVHVFAEGTDTPQSALIQATDGNFYGRATLGGASGSIFRMTPAGTTTEVATFPTFNPSSSVTFGGLVQAPDGNIYGTSSLGGADPSHFGGMIFQLNYSVPARPIAGEVDGDGKTDLVVYWPTEGTWYVRPATSSGALWTPYQWGLPGDVPLKADFDGDGRTDLAVYRPGNGTWYIRFSSSNYSYANWASYQWGLPNDVPLAADFDGDGKSDLVVYRPSDGTWYIRFSASNYSYATSKSYQWGISGDVPMSADFDGDRKTDLAVYRPSDGTWYIRFSSSNYSYANSASYQWGLPDDVPLAADFDGDGKTDLVVYRPSDGTWYVRFSTSNYSYVNWKSYAWGLPGDLPLVADFDGDRKADLVVWRPSNGTWYVRFSSTNYSYANWASSQ